MSQTPFLDLREINSDELKLNKVISSFSLEQFLAIPSINPDLVDTT